MHRFSKEAVPFKNDEKMSSSRRGYSRGGTYEKSALCNSVVLIFLLIFSMSVKIGDSVPNASAETLIHVALPEGAVSLSSHGKINGMFQFKSGIAKTNAFFVTFQ